MGRDLLSLLEWLKYGKVPLLGPQTSALPINQSPLYFYILIPFYIISGRSPYSALILNAVIFLGAFFYCLVITKSYPSLNKAVFIAFLLMIFHPQHIIQNRFVWNPSLLPPLLVTSLTLFLLFIKKKDNILLLKALFLTSVAASLHYSALPLLFVFWVIVLIRKRSSIISSVIFSCLSLFFLNISTILQLLKRVYLSGAFFKPNEIYQTGSNFIGKLNDLIYHGLGAKQLFSGYLLLILLSLIVVTTLFFSSDKIRKISALVFLITVFLTLFSPFNLQAHYVFGITSTLFIFIGSLNKKISIPLVVIFLILFLQPNQVVSYFSRAPRTYNQMDNCFKKFCSDFKEPLFVSVVSDLYPYHYGPEHRYLLMKSGCEVRHIEKDSRAAKYMAVVLDNGSFSSQTNYYELDLFGSSQVEKTINCQKNFGLVLLKK